MKDGTIPRIEPVARIERQELNLSSLRELRWLFYHESAILNASSDGHVEGHPKHVGGITDKSSQPQGTLSSTPP